MGWFSVGGDASKAHHAVDEDDSLEQAPDILVPDSQEDDDFDDGVPFNAGRVASDADPKKPSRLWAELKPCQPWYQVAEYHEGGRMLDIPESFAPASCYAFVWKLLAASFCILTLAWKFVHNEASFLLAYFSYWSLTFGCVYLVLSLLNTVLASRTPQPPATVGWRIRLTWFFYALGLHGSAIAALLYWLLDYDPSSGSISFWTVASHGGSFCVIAVDGMLVNRIPLRLQHWYALLVVDMAYMFWTAIHGLLTDVGNPDREDDDLIYGVIDWKDDWKTSLFWACIVCFVVGPIMYVLLWWFGNNGLCCADRRKYTDSVDPRVCDQPSTTLRKDQSSPNGG